jgi:aspartate ammonia-lyase
MGKEKGDYAVISPNDHVNMSQSTNDAVPTSVCIAAHMRLNELVPVMEELRDTFNAKAKEFDSVIKMGRTHLQDAVPIRLGQEFDAYAKVLQRDIDRIGSTRKGLNVVNIGATAVGTGLNAEQSYIDAVIRHLNEITGLPIRTADSLVDVTQNTDAFVEVSAMLKVCMINMSKIANDIRLMASGPRCGLSEINLPPRQPGSSIMPGKVNPVMPEVVNQVAYQVIGNDETIRLASMNGQLELNVMMPVLILNLIQSIRIMTNAFRVFNEFCVKGITANEESLRESVNNSVGILTAINPHIGYKNSSRIAWEAVETGKSVRELCLRDKVLTEEELDIILDPHEMTQIGISGSSLLKK